VTSIVDYHSCLIYYRVRAVCLGLRSDWSSLISIKTPEPATLTLSLQHELQYATPFDENGVFYWIGTNGGEREYVNPYRNGDVNVQVSCKWYAADAALYVEHKPSAVLINDSQYPCAWVEVDLGADRRLFPNYYCLRGFDRMSTILRSWELQGRENRRESWVTIKRHHNDSRVHPNHSSTRPYAVAAWPLSGDRPFRYFRVVQLDCIHKDSRTLMCSGLELYGTLLQTDRARKESAEKVRRLSSLGASKRR
jgi:E3 ubiquitin-protein ligase HECTD1